MKSIICPYCKKYYKAHRIERHTSYCYLNPTNIKKIKKLFLTSAKSKNYSIINRLSFHKFASKNLIYGSTKIIFDLEKTWNNCIIYLINNFYKNNFLEDYEYELLDATVINFYSNKFFLYSYKEYKERNILYKEDIENEDFARNYYALLYAILKRAIKDIQEDEEYDIEGNYIDLQECRNFLYDFSPETYNHYFD